VSEYINVICTVPIKAKEAVTRNEDGGYTVFIRPDLDEEQMREAYLHALDHIENDWQGEDDVQKIENRAHRSTLY
jgi:hypothetical protein